MKKLFCFVLSCGLLQAQISLIGHAAGSLGTAGNSYTSTAGPVNAASANKGLACVIAFAADPSLATVTSTSGAWTFIAGTGFNSTSSSSTNIGMWARTGSFSSSETLTAAQSPRFTVSEVAYFSNLGAVDQINGSAYSSGTSLTPGSITPGHASELAFTCVGVQGSSGTVTILSGATNLDATGASGSNNQSMGDAYTIQTSAVAFNPSWDLSGISGLVSGAGVNASFLLLSAPASSNMPPVILAARRTDPWLILVDTVKRFRSRQGL